MNFIDRFMKGEFSTEDKKLVLDKTVSVSTDPADEKVVVDNLHGGTELEEDVLQQQKAERDITGTIPLPLFRFEEKQKEEIIAIVKQIIGIANDLIKVNFAAVYTPLLPFINILKEKDVKFQINLLISRNKETFNTSAKEFLLEPVTCYFDKKLRVKLNIEEDKPIDEKVDVDYANIKNSIHKAMIKLTDNLLEALKLKKTGTEKDIEVYLDESSGPEDYGTGYSIFLKYNKNIDYNNAKRGKESYDMFESVFDDDFKRSIESSENSHLIEEQLNINPDLSMEAIADGMSENSDPNAEEQQAAAGEVETSVDSGEAEGMDMTDSSMDPSAAGDMGGGASDMGSDPMGGDDTSSDLGSSETKEPKYAGENPFKEINSKEKILTEFNELKNQIDKVLLKLNQFKSTVAVKKIVELSSFVDDALKNSYTVPLQDSLIRYSLYATQFEDLISELVREFKSKKSDLNNKAR